MKNYFDWLLKDTWEKTDDIFSWEQEKRKPEFEKHILGKKPKIIHVDSKGWISKNKLANLRYTRFQSAVLDVATVMIYPMANPDVLPVFAAEWVAVQNNIHVIVLDVENLDKKLIIDCKALRNLKTKWLGIFPSNKVKPEWFEEIASPFAIFSSATVDKIDSLQEMFKDYLNVCCKEFYREGVKKCTSGGDHDLVRKYKIHHSENSPARKIVSVENEDWLNEFLDKNHFKINS